MSYENSNDGTVKPEPDYQAIVAKATHIREADPTARYLISETEASLVTGLTVSTLQKRRWRGDTPSFYKIGSLVRYNYFELLEFLDDSHATSTTRGE